MSNILIDLQSRGLIYQATDLENLQRTVQEKSITMYSGFDPTADSLHIGNLLPILTMRRLQLAGHNVIALVGGGTGLIGDPGGRTSERKLNPAQVVSEWTEKIKQQLSRFLDFDNKINPARVVNNYEWLKEINLISFLREIGKNFTVNNMLAKESVSSRLEHGISFTEFSYMILQAYDFWHLYRTYGCTLQIGGSDQWGNITAGVDLIRRLTSNENQKETENPNAFAFTIPLITKKDGTKFGKTGTETIWLDANRTTPYAFYQFWLNVADDEVLKLLNYYTLISLEEIAALQESLLKNPERREAQRRLAQEVTLLVHGEQELRDILQINEALFENKLTSLTTTQLRTAAKELPFTLIPTSEYDSLTVTDLLVKSTAAKSKREAKEFLQNGAISINDIKVSNLETNLNEMRLINENWLILRRGKKNYYLCEIKG